MTTQKTYCSRLLDGGDKQDIHKCTGGPNCKGFCKPSDWRAFLRKDNTEVPTYAKDQD